MSAKSSTRFQNGSPAVSSLGTPPWLVSRLSIRSFPKYPSNSDFIFTCIHHPPEAKISNSADYGKSLSVTTEGTSSASGMRDAALCWQVCHHSLARIIHRRTKGTVYGVPALAGQTRFGHGSPSVSSRLQGTTPCRLKPGLHTPYQAHSCYRTARSLVPLDTSKLGGIACGVCD